MSKMFDYTSGKNSGKVAKLQAELEHVMTHCVPGCNENELVALAYPN